MRRGVVVGWSGHYSLFNGDYYSVCNNQLYLDISNEQLARVMAWFIGVPTILFHRDF